MTVLFKEIGAQDADEGGSPIGEVDLGARTIKVGTKLPIKSIAAAYTFVEEDSGTFFKITAALTFTLPAVTVAGMAGCHFWAFIAADVSVTFAATADQMITFNDVDADAIAFSTSSEKVGAAVHFVCDGVAWMAMLHTEETQTVTVTT